MKANGRLLSGQSGITVNTYAEDGYRSIPAIRLGDEEYGRALQRFIGVCTDIVPVDRGKKLVYLAQRKSKPMSGWWWIGGGQMANETSTEAAVRNFLRETGILLAPERLILRVVSDYFWKDRQQEPQTTGCHMLGITFSVDLTDEELQRVKLDSNEYEGGLVVFHRDGLVRAGVFPAILDMYDLIFS